MATGVRDDMPPVKVRIYEVDGLKEVRDALGLEDSSAVAGFYSANALGPFLVTPRKTGYVGEYFDAELGAASRICAPHDAAIFSGGLSRLVHGRFRRADRLEQDHG